MSSCVVVVGHMKYGAQPIYADICRRQSGKQGSEFLLLKDVSSASSQTDSEQEESSFLLTQRSSAEV